MEGYSATIVECSKELSARERIKIKDTTPCMRLDEATQVEDVIITPDYYAIISVHNEKSENKDYEVLVVADKVTGNTYVTGSESFKDAFINIFNEMQGESEEYSVKAYRRESANYRGKEFITCAIL